jgi:hypothetical protein
MKSSPRAAIVGTTLAFVLGACGSDRTSTTAEDPPLTEVERAPGSGPSLECRPDEGSGGTIAELDPDAAGEPTVETAIRSVVDLLLPDVGLRVPERLSADASTPDGLFIADSTPERTDVVVREDGRIQGTFTVRQHKDGWLVERYSMCRDLMVRGLR